MPLFSNYLSFSHWEVIALVILALLVIVQLYYYLEYYRLPYTSAKKGNHSQANTAHRLKVSVIISSENEAARLQKMLPEVLKQDYPDFEVIVISDGSTDETEDLLDSLKVKYKNLYSTYVPFSNDKKFGRKKLAYTLGAKAANGEILLFLEPYSHPVSKNWISSMTQNINGDTDIVIGVSYLSDNNLFFNRIARFDNFLFMMQYLSKALKKAPFTGVYGNVAFKKSLFFDNKGFASNLGLENGEDVFINQVANKDNTAVCIDQDGFTKADIDNYLLWKKTKKNYSLAKSNFKNKGADFFYPEYCSRVAFYSLSVGLIAYSIVFQHLGIAAITFILFLLRFLTQVIVINKGSKYFNSGKYYASIIWLDILQPLYNLNFRTRNKKIKGGK